MARPKMCPNKLSCKLKDPHEGLCDYGLNADTEVSDLRSQLAALQKAAQEASPQGLQDRVDLAEQEVTKMKTAVQRMIDHCQGVGLTILASVLADMLPTEEPKNDSPTP